MQTLDFVGYPLTHTSVVGTSLKFASRCPSAVASFCEASIPLGILRGECMGGVWREWFYDEVNETNGEGLDAAPAGAESCISKAPPIPQQHPL